MVEMFSIDELNKRIILPAALCLAFSFSTSHAQDAIDSPTANQTFEAAYFNVFVPRSAFDMLERIPGFQIVVPDSRRGLGQGGTNILRNGERLTGKSDSAIDQVSRLDAASVLRIEVIDGATSGVPGLSGRVANIITRPPAFSGRWEWIPAFQRGAEPNTTRGSISLSGSSGPWSYTFGLENSGSTFKLRGDERRNLIPTGRFSIAKETYAGDSGGPELSAEFTYQPSDNLIANLELEYSDLNTNEREVSSEFFEQSDSLIQLTNFFFGLDRKQGEIRGDVKMPLGPGSAKFIGFYSFRDDFRNSVSNVFPNGQEQSSSRFETDALRKEFIFRTEYDIGTKSGSTWQVAGEYAQNKLDSQNAFFLARGDTPFTQQILPDPNTNVSEDRWEGTITHNKSFSDDWSLQAALGAEYSTLSQQGLGEDIQESFFRPKGFASLTYTPSERLTIATKVERDVGQLNFSDFVSSINLRENFDQIGNPELVPQQLWRYEADAAWSSPQGHSVNLTLYAEDIEDVVDRIAVGDNGDAIGNIDTASRYGLEFIGTLKGDPWGLKGVQIDVEFETLKSTVVDPISQFERQLNGVTDQRWSVEAQHDIPNTDWAYGGKVSRGYYEPLYRVRSIDDLIIDPFVYVYAEHKDVFGFRVRTGLYNITNQPAALERRLFSNRRDIGEVERIDSRTRRSGPYILLNVSGTF